MCVQQIVGIDGLPTDLGVEVQTTCREASVAQDFMKHQCDLFRVHRELVRIRSQQFVAPIDVQ